MLNTIAFIGVGHLSEYMIQGLRKAAPELQLRLYNPSKTRLEKLTAEDQNSQAFSTAQLAIEGAQLIIVATRPAVVERALQGLVFSDKQVVVCVAAGFGQQQLQGLVAPAQAVRAMPISCVAINLSPTLLYPSNAQAEWFFSLLGKVHTLQNEQQFNPATALVGAYYAWLFPMMGELSNWAQGQGLEASMSRQLLIEINQGACAMASDQAANSFEQIWQSLATEGGISERGLQKIERMGGIKAWSSALDDVTKMMDK